MSPLGTSNRELRRHIIMETIRRRWRRGARTGRLACPGPQALRVGPQALQCPKGVALCRENVSEFVFSQTLAPNLSLPLPLATLRSSGPQRCGVLTARRGAQ
jgi:hypothetical protein